MAAVKGVPIEQARAGLGTCRPVDTLASKDSDMVAEWRDLEPQGHLIPSGWTRQQWEDLKGENFMVVRQRVSVTSQITSLAYLWTKNFGRRKK